MSNKGNFIEEKLLPIAAKLSSNIYLTAIRNGVTLAMPLIIAGSIFMITASFPITAWETWLGETGIAGYLWKAVDSSFGLLGLVAAFGVAHSLATEKGVDGISAGIVNMSAYILVTPFISGDAGSGIPVGFMGSKGLFVALILGLINASIFAWFINHDIQIKLPDTVPPAVSRSFSALIPGFVILSFWLIVFALIDRSGAGNIHTIVMDILGKPLGFLGGSLPGTIIAISLNSFFWFCGIHGGNVVNSIISPIWIMNTDANRLAFQAGETVLPHIITSPFMDNFVWMGGGGATLGLVIVIALIATRKDSSQLSKTMAPLTLTPGIFNINEPAMFGIPVVMNVSLLIPFVLAPVFNAVVTYFAMASGIVPLTTGASIPWTMPPLISGFLATRSIMGSVIQLVCLIGNIAIYYFFYQVVEKENIKLEKGEKYKRGFKWVKDL